MHKLNNPGVKPMIAAIYGVLTQFQGFLFTNKETETENGAGL